MNSTELAHLVEIARKGQFTVTDEQETLEKAFSVLRYKCGFIWLQPGDNRAANGELGVKVGDVIVPDQKRLSPFVRAIDVVLGSGIVENMASLLEKTVENIQNPKPQMVYHMGKSGPGSIEVEEKPAQFDWFMQ